MVRPLPHDRARPSRRSRRRWNGKVKIAKLNVDENPHITSQFGIRSIPALFLFKDGKVASQKVGAAPKNALSNWIQKAVA